MSIQGGMTGQGRRLLRRGARVRQGLRVRPAPAVKVDRLGERRVLEQLPLPGRELPIFGASEAAGLRIPQVHPERSAQVPTEGDRVAHADLGSAARVLTAT